MRLAVIASVLTIADGATEKCQVSVYPNLYPKSGPYKDSTTKCPVDKPAVLTEATAAGGISDDADGSKTACCHAAATCDTTYSAFGSTTLTACPENTVLQKTEKCYTVDIDKTACGAQSAAEDVDIDKAHCCRMECKHGYQLHTGSDDDLQSCDDDGTYEVSTTAVCTTSNCAAADEETCCKKKCETGFVKDGTTPKDPQDAACAATADKISDELFCEKATCSQSKDSQCCLQKCSNGFELFGQDTKDFKQCGTGEVVSADKYCVGPACADSDSETCCLTPCAGAKGFEAHSASKTADKEMCNENLKVHATANCKGTSCSASSSVCCQQKCSAGFKAFGDEAASGIACAEDLTVHATAYCTGSSCGSSDAGTCCQQQCSKGWKLNGASTDETNTCPKATTLAADGKCTGNPCSGTADEGICCEEKCDDKTNGFQVSSGTDSKLIKCAEGELVSSKAKCDGDCSTDDAETCCLKANNSTATTDANGFGLAAAVGMLVILCAAS